MLPRANRITENRQFLKIFKTVRPVHTEHLAFRVAKRNPKSEFRNSKQILNSNVQNKIAAPHGKPGMARNDKNPPSGIQLLPSRFGFVISNKIDKRSARRNGLKRRIRAVVEQKMPEIINGVDVVVQVKKPFGFPYNYQEIETEVLFALKKSDLIK